MRDLKTTRSKKPNSLLGWYEAKNPLRVVLNFLVIYACKYLPSLSAKRFLLRLVGAKIGRGVAFGLGSVVDVFFPELIEVGDNTIIGYDATLLAHEFLKDELRTGKTRVGKNCVIGARTLVLAGVGIADGVVVSAMSLVNKSIEKPGLYGGVPVRPLKKIEEETRTRKATR